MAELVVYGRESCGFCRDFKELCCEEGLKYRDANIDVPANKAEMARKLRSTEWFKGKFPKREHTKRTFLVRRYYPFLQARMPCT